MSLDLVSEFDVFTHRQLEISDIRFLYAPFSEISDEQPEHRVGEALEKMGMVMVKDERSE